MKSIGLCSCAVLLLGLALPAWAAAPAPNEFDCIIEPARIVEVRSPVVGIVQQVHVRRGELIRQGQLMVTIESSVERSAADAARYRADAQGSVQLAQAKVAAAQDKVRRLVALAAEAFVSAQARDDAEAELKLAQAELRNAQEASELARLEHRTSVDQLNRRALRSPFDGVVMDQYLHAGSLVDGGEGRKPILKIAQTDPLVAQAILPVRLFPQVRLGQEVTVVPEAPFTRQISARVLTVDRVVDAAAGTFGVAIQLRNAKQELPGGIRCKVRWPAV